MKLYDSVMNKLNKLDATTAGKCASLKLNFCNISFAKKILQIKRVSKRDDSYGLKESVA